MCLLHEVLAWDDQHIVCKALGHTNKDNPLRRADQLGAAVGVEYAAQAMAVHGALLASISGVVASPPAMGYLTSVRGLSLYVDRLDTQTGPLRVTTTRQSGDARLILYQFSIYCADKCLLEGRASVVLNAESL